MQKKNKTVDAPSFPYLRWDIFFESSSTESIDILNMSGRMGVSVELDNEGENAFFELLSMLDGTREFSQIVEKGIQIGLNERKVKALLDNLYALGALADFKNCQAETLNDRNRWLHQLRFFSRYTSHPMAILKRLREATININDEFGIGKELGCQLAICGIGSILWNQSNMEQQVYCFEKGNDFNSHQYKDLIKELGARLILNSGEDIDFKKSPALRDNIVVAINTNVEKLLEINKRCTYHNIPALYIIPTTRNCIVGPLVYPFESSCLQCVIERDPDFNCLLSSKKKMPFPSLNWPTGIYSAWQSIIALIATLVTSAITRLEEHPLRNKIMIVDIRELSQQKYSILRLPWCKICGRKNLHPETAAYS